MFNKSLAILGNFKQGLGARLSPETTASPAPIGSPAGLKEAQITSVVYANRKWRVRIWGTEWFAESVQPFAFKVGDWVQVVGRRSATTLLIDRN